MRGKGIGRRLVEHSLQTARQDGFTALQFNAVVCTNERAVKLYKDLGFQQLARIKNGYRLKDNSFTDTFMFIKEL